MLTDFKYEENGTKLNLKKEQQKVEIAKQIASDTVVPLFAEFMDGASVEGYSELIKELLETHPVGKNPLGFRNPLGYNGFNGGAYPTFDKDHDEKGRPTYYKK